MSRGRSLDVCAICGEDMEGACSESYDGKHQTYEQVQSAGGSALFEVFDDDSVGPDEVDFDRED